MVLANGDEFHAKMVASSVDCRLTFESFLAADELPPEFLAEVTKLNFDLDPLSGAELQDFFVRADYPPALLERAKAVAKLAEH